MANNNEISSVLKQAAETSLKQAASDLEPVVKTSIARGVTTSEFKVWAVTMGIAILGGVGTALSVLPGPWMLIGMGIMGGLSTLGYTVSRGLAKSNAVPKPENIKR